MLVTITCASYAASKQHGAVEWESGPCEWSVGWHWLRDCEQACSSWDESGGILKESGKAPGADSGVGHCAELPEIERGNAENEFEMLVVYLSIFSRKRYICRTQTVMCY